MPNSCGRSAHSHAVDFHRGNAYAHRHALTILSAGSHALIQLQVVADHTDVFKSFVTVPDQRRSPHRRCDLSVFDQVAFRSRKYEVATGDINLPTRKRRAVEAFRHRANDLLGIAVAGEHVRIRHARHGDMLVTFT